MRFVLNFLLILTFLGCDNEKVNFENIDALEYEVYSVLIDSIAYPGIFAISDSTNTNYDNSQSSLEDVEGAFRNFIIKNDFPDRIDTSRLKIKQPLKIIDDSLYNYYLRLVKNGDDFRIIQDYPGSKGMAVISRVGFNENRDTAMVSVQIIDFYHSPFSNYLLTKSQIGWKIESGPIPMNHK